MKRDRARLRRLRLVGRLREVEHRAATGEAMEASAAERRSQLLAKRAEQLRADSGDPAQLRNGYELAVRRIIDTNIRNVVDETAQAARHAAALAEVKLVAAHKTGKKRDKIHDAQSSLRRAIADQQHAVTHSGPSRRGPGKLREEFGTLRE